MAKFTNNKGVEFELLVTVKTLVECKKQLSFDLAKLLYPGSDELAKVTADPIIMCDLCYLVAQHRKPKEEQISFEEFLDGLSGDALDQAMSAMLDAIADFYPRPDQRAFLRDLKKKATGITAKVFAEAQANLEKIPEADLMTATMTNLATTTSPNSSKSESSTIAGSPQSPSGPSSLPTNSAESSGSPPVNSPT